ncbi:MAG: sugar phosphate isomerase/epimerase family protein [Armatimonadota bacterium]
MLQAKLAYAIWPWGLSTKEQTITGMKDIKDAGYAYFESVCSAIDLFKADVGELKSIAEDLQVYPVSFYFWQSGDYEKDVKTVADGLDFLAELAIRRISVQAPGKPGGGASDEELNAVLRTLDTIGKLTKPYGIAPCLHPHANTMVMFEREIDYVMQRTDPELIAFGPDTAHLTVGGCDPVAIFARYADRIKFTHIKDVKRNKAVSGDEGKSEGFEIYSDFLELGEGDVDLPGVFRVLEEAGYDGYLTAELDSSRFSNRESAFMNMAYFQRALGV